MARITAWGPLKTNKRMTCCGSFGILQLTLARREAKKDSEHRHERTLSTRIQQYIHLAALYDDKFEHSHICTRWTSCDASTLIHLEMDCCFTNEKFIFRAKWMFLTKASHTFKSQMTYSLYFFLRVTWLPHGRIYSNFKTSKVQVDNLK